MLTHSRRVIARFEQRGDGGLQSWSFHTSRPPVTGHLVGETREPSGWELHPVSAWLPALRY